MRKFLLIIFWVILGLGVFVFWSKPSTGFLSPGGKSIAPKKDTSLERYAFDYLQKRIFVGSEIKKEKLIKKEAGYTSWLFSYVSDDKKVTGQLNLPDKSDKLPVVVLLRGYADEEIYFTGLGTRKAAGVLAQNGFITLAPDFLDFGGSEAGYSDILEARFHKPVEVLDLLASIKDLLEADADKIFLWGHSNGGQIALSVLEITRAAYPTVLWAPVTTAFPESVTQYVGEMDDQGLKVQKRLDEFLQNYEAKKYSITNYLADIKAPIQIHQGGRDDLVTRAQTEDFYDTFKPLHPYTWYYDYPRSDHNFTADWDLVMRRTLEFYQKYL
ncbi:MAG: dienelactone hydrolase family protein [Candidatus Shapirobacteria bacterium]